MNLFPVCLTFLLAVSPTRLFQLGGDLEDLESALNKSSQTRPLGSGSCSALIKLLPNNKELLVSHDTWNTYQAMLRIMKKYVFAFKVSPLGNLLLDGIKAHKLMEAGFSFLHTSRHVRDLEIITFFQYHVCCCQ